MTIEPLEGRCVGVSIKTDERRVFDCIAVATSDWNMIIRELKKACLATGGSEEECQTSLEK